MDSAIVAEKLESLRRCIKRIELKRAASAQQLLQDADRQDILTLNLTRAVQLCVDMAAHLLADTEQSAPQTMGDAFDRLAEAATIAAFEDDIYFQTCRAKIIATREWTVKELEALGFSVLPSQANFVFAKPAANNAAELAQKLREQKILVRYFSAPRVNEFLRITIGTDEQMQRMIEVLKSA